MQRKEADNPPQDDSTSSECSAITLPQGSRNVLFMRVIKTSAMLLFMCGLVVAFVYAINSHDESSSNQGEDLNNTKPYSNYQTQYSKNGNFVFELMTPNYNRILSTGTSFWYQDNQKQTLIHKVDNTTVVWVFPNRSFWATINANNEAIDCQEDASVGYREYIRQLSLTNMYNHHSETRKMRGNIEVYVFESDPVRWKHQNVVPFLTQAFVAKNDGRLIEFVSHYNSATNNGWISLGYNFYDMTLKKPPKHTYSDLPKNCQPSLPTPSKR